MLPDSEYVKYVVSGNFKIDELLDNNNLLDFEKLYKKAFRNPSSMYIEFWSKKGCPKMNSMNQKVYLHQCLQCEHFVGLQIQLYPHKNLILVCNQALFIRDNLFVPNSSVRNTLTNKAMEKFVKLYEMQKDIEDI